jgi:hypothetical protein
MDPLTILGLFAVCATLTGYALEDDSPGWTLAFVCGRLQALADPQQAQARMIYSAGQV